MFKHAFALCFKISFSFCFTALLVFFVSFRYLSLLVFPCLYSLHTLRISLTVLLTSSFHHHVSLCLAGPFSFHNYCLKPLVKLLSERSNNLKQKPFLDYSFCTFTLSSYSFHIFLLSTKFLLVSFTFLVLKSDIIGLCWVIYSSMGNTFLSFKIFKISNIYLNF